MPDTDAGSGTANDGIADGLGVGSNYGTTIQGKLEGGVINGSLFDNTDRRTKAIWNMASEAGLRVAVVGWWMTFPVEPVNGVMVAQTNTTDQLRIAHGRHVCTF